MQIRKRRQVWLLVAKVGQVCLAIPILCPWVASVTCCRGLFKIIFGSFPRVTLRITRLSAITEVVIASPCQFAIALLVEHAAWAVLVPESPLSRFFTSTICSAFVLQEDDVLSRTYCAG